MEQKHVKAVYEAAKASLLTLLKTHSFDEVSVKMIAEKGGFSRQYFYRFYPGKMELISDVFLEDVASGLNGAFQAKRSMAEIIRAIQRHAGLYRSLILSSYTTECYKLFYKTGLLFVNAMARSALLRAPTPQEYDMADLFFHGVVSILFDRLVENRELDDEGLSELFVQATPPRLSFILSEDTMGETILYYIEKGIAQAKLLRPQQQK